MPNLNILIVEDESLLALDLSSLIKSYNYNVVDYVTNSDDAKKVHDLNHVDLIIMDINLNEELDGIELYKSLKTEAKVIYITAYMDDATITKAIETQPLGYLIKPYQKAELLALLKLAQLQTKKSTTVQLPYNYTYDTQTRLLSNDEKTVKLGAKQAKLLEILIAAQGHIVTFTDIEEELYKDNPPSASSIRTLVYRLRSSLKAEMIESELNHGIRLKVL